ncbi:RNA polymerase sigma factor [Pararhodobacter sp.]|uniref:RNA polymerase sigma factor n=1 Tax=Pararhodobacter sp. TaxID=2127056 RepID=UPI002FE05FFF
MSWDLNRLFRLHAREITGALRLRGASRDLAEDLMQDAFLRLLSAPPRRAEGRDNPRGYLFRIARNLLIDRVRREGRLPVIGLDLTDLGQLPDTAPNPEAALYQQERLDRIAAALAEMPERTRHAFALHRLHGATMAEVAAEMGISTSRAWGLIHEAYRHLRACLHEG